MLNLYRRHRLECEAGRPENFRTGEFEERKKGWKRCACLIFASGTLAGKFGRRSTFLTNWEQAKNLVSNWTSWDKESAPPQPEPVPEVPVPARVGTTIEAASKGFLADQEGEAAKSTVRMYRYLMNALKQFADEKGYTYIDQLERASVAAFEETWGVGSNTARKNRANLKTFFEFCMDKGWIENNPARGRRRRKTRNSRKEPERIPFSDEELDRMFAACEHEYGKTEHAYRYRWTGQDLSDFISVSVYTGLRISDVATFHADRLLKSGECHIRTTKTGKKVYTWVPTWLQERIRARAHEFGPLIFGDHETDDIESITDQWRRKLKRLWNLCGPWSAPPTHHRFRHTFARILLQQGDVSVRDVAELLGDTEETVRKHYAAWVPERQERLTKVLKQAFEDKPKPKVLKFPPRKP